MASKGKPSLLSDDLYKALKERTGVPASVCEKVLKAYSEIIKQGIVNQVEIPLCGVGTFTWKEIPCLDYNEWLGSYYNEKGELDRCIFYLENCDGKLYPEFRPTRSFGRSIMDNTIIPYDAKNSLPGNKDRYSSDYIRINYREYYNKHQAEEDAKKEPLYDLDDYDLLVDRSELHAEG